MTARTKGLPRWILITGAGVTIAGGLTALGVVTPGWATKDDLRTIETSMAQVQQRCDEAPQPGDLAAVDDKATKAQQCCTDVLQQMLDNQAQIQENQRGMWEVLRRLDQRRE
jgi:soluble cytochrome b562